MKAAFYRRYGELTLEDAPTPAPGDDEVLIRVHAASVNPLDCHFFHGKPKLFRVRLGLRQPKIPRLGVDVAGVVDAVGRNVTRFKTGDAVFGAARGSFAELVCTAQSRVVRKPANVTFEHAAAVPVAGLTALQALRGRVQPGQRVLINGASGGVGTFAVQIAKSFGAIVTGVCSTRNLDLVRSLGADHVIDYTQADFTRGDERYDLIVDIIGNHPLSRCFRVLTPAGTCLLVGGQPWTFLARLLRAAVARQAKLVMAKQSQADLETLGEMLAQGTITPAIDRTYDLDDVEEALAYGIAGHTRGKVIVQP